MLLPLPDLWIVVLNVVGIPLAHFGCSWAFTRLPSRLFDPGRAIFRIRSWERGGWLYGSLLQVRRWKHLLPDAAPWFGGFAKRNLRSADPAFLRTFRVETCRGEAAHYAQIITISLFVLWTPWPAAALIVVYAFLSNLPCIVLQRHNRLRLERILGHGTPRQTSPAEAVPPATPIDV